MIQWFRKQLDSAANEIAIARLDADPQEQVREQAAAIYRWKASTATDLETRARTEFPTFHPLRGMFLTWLDMYPDPETVWRAFLGYYRTGKLSTGDSIVKNARSLDMVHRGADIAMSRSRSAGLREGNVEGVTVDMGLVATYGVVRAAELVRDNGARMGRYADWAAYKAYEDGLRAAWEGDA